VNERDTVSLIEGMKLIEKGMMDHLEKEGLEQIDAEGSRFDPNLHEAMELQVVDDREKDGLVAEELTRGFLYKGALLRPARVKVYKYVEAKKEKE
jgi:molecular chaperone GrpE